MSSHTGVNEESTIPDDDALKGSTDSPVPAKCWLLSLPNELLHEIAKLTATTTSHIPVDRRDPKPPLDQPPIDPAEISRTVTTLAFATARSIALVCRQLRDIASHILYKELYVGFHGTRTIREVNDVSTCHWHHPASPCDIPQELTYFRTLLLWRALKENPSLRSFCRVLHLSLDLGDDGDLDRWQNCAARANDLISWLDKTQRLSIVYKGNTGAPLGPGLAGADGGIRIKAALDCGNKARVPRLLNLACGDVPSLMWLASSSMSEEDQAALGTNDPRAWLDHDPRAMILRKVVPDAGSILTGLTSLSISEYCPWHRQPLCKFLRKVKCLQHFSLDGYDTGRKRGYPGEPEEDWNLGKIFSMLTAQQETLKTLTLYGVTGIARGLKGFVGGFAQLCSFTSLESLYLSRYDTGTELTRENVEGILSAPKLRTFTWRLDPYAQSRLRPVAEEGFLRHLCEKAMADKHPLTQVHVILRPAPKRWGPPGDKSSEFVHARDWINALADEIALGDSGIRVTHDVLLLELSWRTRLYLMFRRFIPE